MKHGLRPTLKQKKQIAKTTGPDGQLLNPKHWLVYKQSPNYFWIRNKLSGERFGEPIYF